MSEKPIQAYFHSPEEAAGAAAKLRALRAAEVQVAGSEISESDNNTLLTAVVDEMVYNQAVRVIDEAKGMLG
ncbi:hypothetical protein D3C73_581740 [compost metagenome]